MIPKHFEDELEKYGGIESDWFYNLIYDQIVAFNDQAVDYEVAFERSTNPLKVSVYDQNDEWMGDFTGIEFLQYVGYI